MSDFHGHVKRMKKRKAFTLIELLVVIAIIALLLAVLVPSLGKVKNQARAVVCKSNLHQWGLIFALYTNDYDSRFMPGIDEDWATAQYCWIYTLIPYYDDPSIRLCPIARRTTSQGGASPRKAWDMNESNPGDLTYLKGEEYRTGSYGLNWWVNSSEIDRSGVDGTNKWRRADQKNAGQIPVLMDAGFFIARPQATDIPPPYDGLFAWADGARGMDRVCTNRHSGNVHILYMDWSAGKVELTDLWRKEWHRNYTPMVHEWPEWMLMAK